jgi:CRISPR-associated exonuclease Cas4
LTLLEESPLSSVSPEELTLGHDESIKFTGSQVNYYFICKRKLWLFSHNIELEPESDLVKLGKLLHENRYKRKLKEVQIDRIKVDFMESKRPLSSPQDQTPSYTLRTVTTDFSVSNENALSIPVAEKQGLGQTPNATGTGTRSDTLAQKKELLIHEVKRSKKMQDAHLYQLLYYMYSLQKNYGVNAQHGILHYPLLSQNVDVFLSEERIKQMEEALRGIQEVNSQSRPPEATWKSYCRSCAYCELCWG